MQIFAAARPTMSKRTDLPTAAVWILGAAILLRLITPVLAEELRGADIANLDAVALGISQITPEGLQCGLDPADLLDTARQTLGEAGIAMRDDATSRVTVSVITTREGGAGAERCASAIMLGAYRRESYFSADTGWLQNGFVVLWQRSLLQMTPEPSHAATIAAGIRRISAQLLSDRQTQRRAAAAAKTADVTAATNSAPKPSP